jgi:hypothetical protein
MKPFADIAISKDTLDAWESEVVLSTGEIVELPEAVARVRMVALRERETERIAWCARHGKDPATFGQRPHECFGCGGTGWNHANHLPCWCQGGKSALKMVKAREDAETERCREIVMNQRRVK